MFVTSQDFLAFMATASDVDILLAQVPGLLVRAFEQGHKFARLTAPSGQSWSPRLTKELRDKLEAAGYSTRYQAATGWPSEESQHFKITPKK